MWPKFSEFATLSLLSVFWLVCICRRLQFTACMDGKTWCSIWRIGSHLGAIHHLSIREALQSKTAKIGLFLGWLTNWFVFCPSWDGNNYSSASPYNIMRVYALLCKFVRFYVSDFAKYLYYEGTNLSNFVVISFRQLLLQWFVLCHHLNIFMSGGHWQMSGFSVN